MRQFLSVAFATCAAIAAMQRTAPLVFAEGSCEQLKQLESIESLSPSVHKTPCLPPQASRYHPYHPFGSPQYGNADTRLFVCVFPDTGSDPTKYSGSIF